ncbi:sulfite exporter TauE/SafE family protein [bacterium]|nr:sulfite exporter TauE/SafE family protein [bacterium]
MDTNILLFILVGFVAQLVDGSLGMAYGVSSTTFLLSLGVPPAAASASVHTAEVFTTAVSGASHWKLGNVDQALLKKLVLPGVIGGVLGAYILTSVPPGVIKPIIAIYLLIMGLRILWKARLTTPPPLRPARHTILALVGGFCDAMGGGGWGPIVTSTLVANGHHPRYTIGSVNLAEFFVTLAEALTFVALLGFVHWRVIAGLMIGGVLAAPLGALLCRRLPVRVLMLCIGTLITLLSVRTLLLAFS